MANSRQSIVVGELELDSGEILRDVHCSYMSWGQLNEQRSNVLILCHALNCAQDVSEWWGNLLGYGCALDTSKYFVFCANDLGGCYGTTGPEDIDARTGKRFGGTFPQVTIRDMVRLQAMILTHLGITEVACVIGGGLGGMLALEWAIEVRSPATRAIASLCSCGRHQPWQIGWHECQRQAIFADPLWHNGDYEPEARPLKGLSVARMMAMVFYKTEGLYWNKFGRSRALQQQRADFDVQSYLQHQGDKFLDRGFSPASYVILTRAMDSHDVGRGRGNYEEVLAKISIPVLVVSIYSKVSISSDVLYPVSEQLDLAKHIPNAQHHMIESQEGHDGFLLERSKIGTLIHGFVLNLEAVTMTRAGAERATSNILAKL